MLNIYDLIYNNFKFNLLTQVNDIIGKFLMQIFTIITMLLRKMNKDV